MTTIRVGYEGNIEEVEGIPLSPEKNEYYDEASGECNITFSKCDCDKELVSFGCAKCERAMYRYIGKLVKTDCIKPNERVTAQMPGTGREVSFWRNKLNTVFMHTDEDLEAVRDNWYFRFLKEVPPTLWNVTVTRYEYPYAFALDKAMGGLKPERVLMGAELPLIFVMPNRYYVIAPCLWRSVEDIKEGYRQLAESIQAEEEAKKKLDDEMKSRQGGMLLVSNGSEKAKKLIEIINKAIERFNSMTPEEMKEFNDKIDAEMLEIDRIVNGSKVPDTQARPIISTRDKRRIYRNSRPTEIKTRSERPGTTQTLDQVRDTPTKEVYTTRGVRTRRYA